MTLLPKYFRFWLFDLIGEATVKLSEVVAVVLAVGFAGFCTEQ